MIQTFNSSKTAEILARYRPIAPKPPDHDLTKNNTSNSNSNPPGIIMSEMMMPERSYWPQLQARPTKTRKRDRALLKPRRSNSYVFSPYFSPKNNLSAFLASPNVLLPIPNYTMAASTTTVQATVKNLDLNMNVPVEKDLLQQLQAKEGAIVPRPIKLVSSAITIHPQTISNQSIQGPTKAKEIEVEVESETLPAVISDSKNKVRLANSAYNKLVGQPECSWLDSISGCGGDEAVTCNKICGEVMLQISDTAVEEFVSTSNGFFGLVVIEWGNSEYKNSITTFGEAVRLFCDSRDYMFAWRFHTQGTPNF